MRRTLFFLLFSFSTLVAKVQLGVDLFFQEHKELVRNKRVGLITNHTGVNSRLERTSDLFAKNEGWKLVALFAPEHGLEGAAYAWESVKDSKHASRVPIYSLHGETRRPTEEMLKNIDVLVFDMQDIGVRTYTYATTLFYAMEEAAKRGILVIVLDRPNPINGEMVDGPMLRPALRSYIGYINVPYCHGMTIGELARFFNEEYKIGCLLKVVPMKGWKRSMNFEETGLAWIPTSPQIPEPDTPLFFASTGVLGELGLVNIGIGYTLPFKVIGAPWIRAKEFAEKLNAQGLSGVHFLPFYFRPWQGSFKGKDCQGVFLVVTQKATYRPLTTQYFILGMLKALYPKHVESALAALSKQKKELFCKANGNEEMWQLLSQEKYVSWKLVQFDKERREQFLLKRQKYLLY